MKKNIENLINKEFLTDLGCFLLFGASLKFNMLFSDKDKFFISKLIIEEIREEYIICGKRRRKFDSVVYILCIVESVKKKPLTEKYKENETINRDNLRVIKL